MGSTVDLYAIQARVGGQVRRNGRSWQGPGPGHSRGDASLKVDLTDEDRALICSFAGDPFGECLRHLGIDTGRAESTDRATFERLQQERLRAERLRVAQVGAFCEGVVARCDPPEGTLVERYLSRHRGVTLGADLYFNPRTPFAYDGGRRGPAMVAIARGAGGVPKGLHITHLGPDGAKLRRTCFGSLTGAAVRLQPAQRELAVAEGIETALSFAELYAVPTWAALSASGLAAFVAPPGIRRLVIAADADDRGAGLVAAQQLAERMRGRCDVEIHSAPQGQDWNDVLQGVGK